MKKEIPTGAYTVFFTRGTRNYGERQNVPTMAWINCLLEINVYTGAGTGVTFVFVDGDNIPANSSQVSAKGFKAIFVFLSSRYYAAYLDILRNEKPIWFEWYDDALDHWELHTKPEPVGEGPGEAVES